MWLIALFPIVGIVIGILLYFLRPFFNQDDVFTEEEMPEGDE